MAYNSVDAAIDLPVAGWRRRQGVGGMGGAIEPPVTGWMRQPGWRTVQASLNQDPLNDYRTDKSGYRTRDRTGTGEGNEGKAGAAYVYFDPSLRGVGISI